MRGKLGIISSPQLSSSPTYLLPVMYIDDYYFTDFASPYVSPNGYDDINPSASNSSIFDTYINPSAYGFDDFVITVNLLLASDSPTNISAVVNNSAYGEILNTTGATFSVDYSGTYFGMVTMFVLVKDHTNLSVSITNNGADQVTVGVGGGAIIFGYDFDNETELPVTGADVTEEYVSATNDSGGSVSQTDLGFYVQHALDMATIQFKSGYDNDLLVSNGLMTLTGTEIIIYHKFFLRIW